MIAELCWGGLATIVIIGVILGVVIVRQINKAAQDEAAMNGEPE